MINSNRIGEMEVEYHLHEDEATTNQEERAADMEREKEDGEKRKKWAIEDEARRKKSFNTNREELFDDLNRLETEAKEQHFRRKACITSFNFARIFQKGCTITCIL